MEDGNLPESTLNPIRNKMRRLHHLLRILSFEIWIGRANATGVVFDTRRESMKVVLFCGGYGLRIRDAENVPKPLVQIGYRPVIWHVMKYYAHFGHKDFILCLGYGADQIKRYFLDYSECVSNDFVLSSGGRKVELFHSDIHDWRITFADTGINSNIGQRLKSVERYLEGEEEFLANYSDGLTDLPLPGQLENFHRQDRIASFLCVLPNLSYHVVSTDPDTGLVSGVQPNKEWVGADQWRVLHISQGDLRLHASRRGTRGLSHSRDSLKRSSSLAIHTMGSGAAWTHSKTSRNSRVSGAPVRRPGKCGERAARRMELPSHSLPFRSRSLWIADMQTEMGLPDPQDRESMS